MSCADVVGGTAAADESPRVSVYPYPVRMRVELLSIRNRSCSPVPVQIKLEYNEPKILEGDLELHLYDALDIVRTDGLLATLTLRDIVLSGGDYIFNTVLPPLQTSNLQNLALQAWFATESQRIPLSSSLKEVNPPKPHDLLMPSPFERVSLLCSCTGSTVFNQKSAGKAFLDRALSLENYNPVPQLEEADGAAGQTQNILPRRTMESMGRHIQYYPATWSARDLPQDPLAYCCFDIVLLSDGALSKLDSQQMEALTIWLRAGGSLCVVPDGRLNPAHVAFLQTLLEDSSSGAPSMFLDDEGRLQDETLAAGGIRLGQPDLGRVVLLPVTDDPATVLTQEQLGQAVAWLWKVRQHLPVRQGLSWADPSVVEALAARGIRVESDARGYYVQSGSFPGSRYSMNEDQLRETYGLDERLAPVRLDLADTAADVLLPDDVEMVPTWVIGCILAAYVVMIGPVDYIVLGWMRMRKATWVVFPVVTALFTGLTIAVAHHYMGSSETGGSVEIVDVGDAGTPLRRSRVEMLFYGSRVTHSGDYQHAIASSVAEFVPPSTYGNFNDPDQMSASGVAGSSLQYDGHFPATYRMTQTIQQWSPQLNRVFELAPSDVDLPALDWTDPDLVTSEEKRRALADVIRRWPIQPGETWQAVVLHQWEVLPVVGNVAFEDPLSFLPIAQRRAQQALRNTRNSLYPALIAATTTHSRADFFRLVSRVSPQGSGYMEDLIMADASNPAEWVLLLVKQSGNEYHVYRKLYDTETPGAVREN